MADSEGEPWTEISAGVNESKEVGGVVVEAENSAKSFKCPVCGKPFLSEKAIHGHMRWHPTRSNRGMEPPKKPSLPITSCSGNGQNRRHPKRHTCDDEVEDEEESMWGAICSLMLIATRDERYRITPTPTSKKNTTRVSQNSLVSSKKASVETETEREMVIYKCSLCSRCFLSPQALGGHTSSAHKTKKVEVEKGRRRGASLDPRHHRDESSRGSGVLARHVCKICNLEFPRGQALGGHMKVHINHPSSK